MSIATLILGTSGSGKSTSLRSLDPTKALLVQCVKKPLPFRAKGWKVRADLKDSGNVIQTDNPQTIEAILRKSPQEIVVIDDFQAMMVNELMTRSTETGFQKFADIGKQAWSIFQAAGSLASNRRVYILAHTQTDDYGNVRMRTVGKMVDEKIVPESYFTIVLRTTVNSGQYQLATQTNGQDCCKSPIGMFPDMLIDNDLALVDRQITSFYEEEMA